MGHSKGETWAEGALKVPLPEDPYVDPGYPEPVAPAAPATLLLELVEVGTAPATSMLEVVVSMVAVGGPEKESRLLAVGAPAEPLFVAGEVAMALPPTAEVADPDEAAREEGVGGGAAGAADGAYAGGDTTLLPAEPDAGLPTELEGVVEPENPAPLPGADEAGVVTGPDVGEDPASGLAVDPLAGMPPPVLDVPDSGPPIDVEDDAEPVGATLEGVACALGAGTPPYEAACGEPPLDDVGDWGNVPAGDFPALGAAVLAGETTAADNDELLPDCRIGVDVGDTAAEPVLADEAEPLGAPYEKLKLGTDVGSPNLPLLPDPEERPADGTLEPAEPVPAGKPTLEAAEVVEAPGPDTAAVLVGGDTPLEMTCDECVAGTAEVSVIVTVAEDVMVTGQRVVDATVTTVVIGQLLTPGPQLQIVTSLVL
ncbi:hypothetical protein B0A48_15261 [Cryoendolithus antarcticus]|uniref:Uncharacterized protein n=1 Tax=Cryoendolithus antarcticus TaxID=1507870 RepID=A0A1V8SIE4_9PEZI|nr:hypothetical protein B0A48_15261 [Cryoendolithus antarcticus]